MKAVLPVRRALGVRTVFNVLGPLLNPAGARRQVMGVYAARLVPVVAQAMVRLGVRHAFVVHGDGGLDELSLSGPSQVAEVMDAGTGDRIRTYTITPEDVGLKRAPLSTLRGGETAQEKCGDPDQGAGSRGSAGAGTATGCGFYSMQRRSLSRPAVL